MTPHRIDHLNDAHHALRELLLLADLLTHVDATDLRPESAASLGERLDAIAERLQAAVDGLGSAP